MTKFSPHGYTTFPICPFPDICSQNHEFLSYFALFRFHSKTTPNSIGAVAGQRKYDDDVNVTVPFNSPGPKPPWRQSRLSAILPSGATKVCWRTITFDSTPPLVHGMDDEGSHWGQFPDNMVIFYSWLRTLTLLWTSCVRYLQAVKVLFFSIPSLSLLYLQHHV